MSDDLPRKQSPLSAVEQPLTMREVVDYVAASALEQVKEAHHAELADLRSRIESLERAHGLKPGTSMHANWEEGNE